jgi:ribosome biogenesis GTPase
MESIMFEMDVEGLRRVGLTAAHAACVWRVACAVDEPTLPLAAMRVVEVHRETVRLHDGCGDHTARLLPRLLRELAEAGAALAVGDWVIAGVDAHGQRWVHARAEPLTALVRRDGDGRRHALVSNVDTALLVMGLDDDFSPRRLERFVALVQTSGVVPVVVLSKADVVGAARVEACREALRTRLPAQVERLAVDATDAAAARALVPWLDAGQTLVLLGSSGAGKSTLTNTLVGAQVQDTGAVRDHDSRGKHTTTARALHRLPGGACIVDTPGLRTLRPDAGEDAVARSFDDIATLATRCRFRDCRHGDEPGCAVRAAVDPDRLRNYHKLLREARRDTLTALDRARQVGEWKSRTKAVRAWMKVKRG